MAIYHFTAKVISRSKGRSAVAAAAYRSASEIHDFRQDLNFDYSGKPDVIHRKFSRPKAPRNGFTTASFCGMGSKPARNGATRRSPARSSSLCPRS